MCVFVFIGKLGIWWGCCGAHLCEDTVVKIDLDRLVSLGIDDAIAKHVLSAYGLMLLMLMLLILMLISYLIVLSAARRALLQHTGDRSVSPNPNPIISVVWNRKRSSRRQSEGIFGLNSGKIASKEMDALVAGQSPTIQPRLRQLVHSDTKTFGHRQHLIY